MTAKEYLSQYKLLDTEINSKIEQVEQLDAKATSISHMAGGGTGGHFDRVGIMAAEIADAKDEVIASIGALLMLKLEIEQTIAAVENPVYRLILTLKYINCHELKQVAEEMNYSYKQICRLHGEALFQIKL